MVVNICLAIEIMLLTNIHEICIITSVKSCAAILDLGHVTVLGNFRFSVIRILVEENMFLAVDIMFITGTRRAEICANMYFGHNFSRCHLFRTREVTGSQICQKFLTRIIHPNVFEQYLRGNNLNSWCLRVGRINPSGRQRYFLFSYCITNKYQVPVTVDTIFETSSKS